MKKDELSIEEIMNSPRSAVKCIQDQFDSAFNVLREKDLIIKQYENDIALLNESLDKAKEKIVYYYGLNDEGNDLRWELIVELKKSTKVIAELCLITLISVVVGALSFVYNVILSQ